MTTAYRSPISQFPPFAYCNWNFNYTIFCHALNTFSLSNMNMNTRAQSASAGSYSRVKWIHMDCNDSKSMSTINCNMVSHGDIVMRTPSARIIWNPILVNFIMNISMSVNSFGINSQYNSSVNRILFGMDFNGMEIWIATATAHKGTADYQCNALTAEKGIPQHIVRRVCR